MVVSPDEGSIKRALAGANRMGGEAGDCRQTAVQRRAHRQENIIGASVQGKVAVLFDDMISTAGSICGAAAAVHLAGARKIFIAATHGILCGPAIERIQEAPIEAAVITDTIPLPPERAIPKITVLSVAPLLGEAIKRIHRNESVSRLFV